MYFLYSNSFFIHHKKSVSEKNPYPGINELVRIILILCKIGGGILLILVILFATIYKYRNYVDNTPQKDSYYIHILEDLVQEPLPSCKVLAKEYMAEVHEGVIFQMNPEDYEKVRQGLITNKSVQPITSERVDFNSMEGMLEKVFINTKNIEERYLGKGEWGLKPPDIVIYQQWLD